MLYMAIDITNHTSYRSSCVTIYMERMMESCVMYFVTPELPTAVLYVPHVYLRKYIGGSYRTVLRMYIFKSTGTAQYVCKSTARTKQTGTQ